MIAKFAEQNSEIAMLKAQLEIVRKELEDFHIKCQSQKVKISVASQTEEVTTYKNK